MTRILLAIVFIMIVFLRTSATSFVKVGRKGSVMNDPSPNFTHSRNFATFQKYEIIDYKIKKVLILK